MQIIIIPSKLITPSDALIVFVDLSSTKHKVQCLLDGKEPVESISRTKRKKRSAPVTEPKYGCPDDFEKVTEYLCLHLNDEPKTIEESKEYCQNQNEGQAILLYLLNSQEASTVWEWLGGRLSLLLEII